MSKSVVILQPQYIPWIGIFEQIRLANVFVHYDDVQYPQGRSFTSRVQVKTPTGQKWITVPIKGSGIRNINEAIVDDEQKWRHKHKETLRHTYSKAPYINEMMTIAEDILAQPAKNLAQLNSYALEKISNYFELNTEFSKSSELGIGGKSTKRLADICSHYGADKYITGLGARNYIDYDQFEEKNIELHYMQYEKKPYPQINGDFTPYVTILDLIAHCGKDGRDNICSRSKYWKSIPDIMNL